MKTINRIIIENFKFFYGREELNFDSKNVAIYGENGSGKSSLYWTLYTFLQSAMKKDNEIEKYFNKNNKENLKNIYNLDKDSYIEIEIIDDDKIKKSYKISQNIINTNKNKEDTQILKSNLTSDFINYKLLSKVYDFKHSQDIDLWEFFDNYILDFIAYNADYPTLKLFWEYLKKWLQKINNRYPTMNSKEYKEFQEKMNDFNEKLNNLLIEIQGKANLILKENFKENIEIKFIYYNGSYNEFFPDTKKRNHKTLPPKILLKVKFFEKDLSKPHSFLNEARLTSIALSIRFAILKNRFLSEDVLKILVLDDLLISLDMSKRFEVIDFILNDENLQSYQKIILTHDKSFFEIFKYKLNQLEWKIYEFYSKKENNLEKQFIKEYKDNLTKAKEMFEKKRI
jgi:ABC-type cobalamin/Fe3+-siderophores transport system ATPase subunit